MSNTNNMRYPQRTVYNAAMYRKLPPLSSKDVISKRRRVCAAVQLYLAVWDDLTPEEIRLVSNHLRMCERCAHQQVLFVGAARSITSLPATQPSSRVDHAVFDAITARSQANMRILRTVQVDRRFAPPFRGRTRTLPHSLLDLHRSPVKVLTLVGLLILVIFSSAYFLIKNGSQHVALTLPANLSWDKYVLYEEQAMTSPRGQSYTMTSYHEMSTDNENIEVVVPGKIDIVVVKDTQRSLGLDMLHNVAEWDAPSWIQSDTSMFDLDRLRKDLQTGQATYLGKDFYNRQPVYRIRIPDGKQLLLGEDYMPINVLENVNSTGTGIPMYTMLRWLEPHDVPSSTWDMTVPPNFNMGTLPPEP